MPHAITMSDTVIKVENLSKQYRIGAKEGYRTFRETLVDAAKAPLQDISKLLNRKSQFTNRNLSGSMLSALSSMPYAPSSMPSSLCDEHERKRMYRFAEQIRGSGISISNKKRIKAWASP